MSADGCDGTGYPASSHVPALCVDLLVENGYDKRFGTLASISAGTFKRVAMW